MPMRGSIACLFFVLAMTGPAPAKSPQEILIAADAVRNPGQPFYVVSTLTEYVGGTADSSVVLAVYSKENPATREYATLMRYIGPPRDRGKMVLMNGSSMWFYDNASKASVRISPQQRLMGQAAEGDVVTVNFSRDYLALRADEEIVENADGRSRTAWRLELQAADDSATYGRIEYWVEKSTYRAVKGKFYSDSGRLLKTAYYRKYMQMLGGQRPQETILIDAIDANLVTTISYADSRFVDIPNAWFQREYLPRLRSK
jgi:hypothetical protein